ncbi:hypothetical protein D9611_008390 [Ephemerocybe angulata]|uniref:protein-tyrosine-phosphatase n=1 Tax=Ephemerocybe angulata TaxID=980116 RepID=A0A8H5BIP3_9AGAR|nr:hypothetical protein D9611_008390 [Tulosesus angulatus]
MAAPSYPRSQPQQHASSSNGGYPAHVPRASRTPHHQNTWPLMTLTSALPSLSTNPPSANPFSPTPNVANARNVSEIVPRVYISDLAFAENPALLSSYRITHVLSTLPDTIFCPPPSLLPRQPVRLQIRVDDLPFAELAAHLPATTAFIRDALAASPDARVLVHCGEGISRSVSVVAAYLMAQYGWGPTEAVGYIKSKRRIAEPNFGFVQQLHEYARDSLGRVCPTPALPPFSAPVTM